MRARIGVSLVLVVSTLLAGLIGMRAASGQTVLHLLMPADGLKARIINHNGPGLRLGDRIAARASVTDAEGTRVGTAYGDCVVHRQITDPVTGLWNCTYVLDLADGDLILKGLDPRGPGVYELAVLGGTGVYADASGDATFTDTGDDTGEVGVTDMVIRLGG
ncbi:MAG TPA: hypothetical protein VJ927_12365 [Actinomycetota bacterium]|nr:hypothetical protein [Actinomycetota bacterium]